MIFQDKKYFLEFLTGMGKCSVIFEPFISREHTETLIWRRGEHLWGNVFAYVDTLAALSKRSGADVVFCDMRIWEGTSKAELIGAIENYKVTDDNDGIGFGVICANENEIRIAEKSAKVCVAAVYGNALSGKLPVIRMDGSLDEAILRGDCGWYAADEAEKYLTAAQGRIRILGGLGRNLILNSSPVQIYDTVEKLSREYPGMWACGSGFEIPDGNYLELISLLGAFRRVRQE